MLGLVLDSLGNSSLGPKDSGEQEQRRSGSGGREGQRGSDSMRRVQSVWRRMRSESKAMV